MTEPHRPLTLAVVEVTNARPHARSYDAYTRGMITRTVNDATALGWDAMLLSAEQLGTAALLDATERADAIAIMGGEDIAPEFYGASGGYEGEGRHYRGADAAELALVRRAALSGTPLLGICRGHQIINVAFGGTLLQHVQESGHRITDLPVEYALVEHPVQLDRSSTLALRLGEHVTVQSGHHQVVDRVGRGLRAVGWSPDGHIEAIEHEVLPITGVQWHPEAPLAAEGQLERLLDGLEREALRGVLA
ncbi:putative glutamine amidotransferase [Paramicrobacterium humi]|uniref:Putative glutamine amidotransferase n=1 Tax=Paramicrobacterium humi TaxID=640635 RepID=A0A1H4PAC9_9MICO|nr:gamma-glutamyl-gamma-aminobutyrate hydrolase family protein [Microbacterium humi]SEC04295.1 putative glutamine amidotransferase [Microbacterium humi]